MIEKEPCGQWYAMDVLSRQPFGQMKCLFVRVQNHFNTTLARYR